MSGCIHDTDEDVPSDEYGLSISISTHRFFAWDDPWDNGVSMFVYLNYHTRDNIQINDSFHLGGSLSIQVHSPSGKISYARAENQTPLESRRIDNEYVGERIYIGYDLIELVFEDEEGTCLIPWDEEGNHTIKVFFHIDGTPQLSASTYLNIGGNPQDYPHYRDELDVRVNDIWIWFVIEWGRPSVDSYVLIPTLAMEDGTILTPIYEMIEEGKDGEEHPRRSENISVVESEYGMALRYNITGSSVFQLGSPPEYRSEIRVPYILDRADIVFSTWDVIDIRDRFFEEGPGFSIWTEEECRVKTWTYIDDEANWIRLYLERRGNMSNSHSWGVFDCYEDITYQTSGSGWFNIELERRTSFPSD
ncbi:MAG: hypothetical protein ACMUHM_01320 [Thermoplasmatota archaeon]